MRTLLFTAGVFATVAFCPSAAGAEELTAEQTISPQERDRLQCSADSLAMKVTLKYTLFSRPHTDERIKQDIATMVLNYEFEPMQTYFEGYPLQFSIFHTKFEEALKTTNRLPAGGTAELDAFVQHAMSCKKWTRPEAE